MYTGCCLLPNICCFTLVVRFAAMYNLYLLAVHADGVPIHRYQDWRCPSQKDEDSETMKH